MRTNQKTTSKYYDTMQVDGWKANFEYETVNNVLSGKLQVVAGVEGTAQMINIFKEVGGQLQVITSNTEYDGEAINVMVSEIKKIENEYASPVLELEQQA